MSVRPMGTGRQVAIGKPSDLWGTTKRLLRYVGTSQKMLLLCLLLVAISSIASIGASYLLRPIINDYIIPGDFQGLIKMLLLLGGVYVTGSLSDVVQSRLMIRLAQNTVHKIRAELFAHVQQLPIEFFDTTPKGELMSRFSSDMDKISEALNNSISAILNSVIMLMGILTMMLFISPLLTLLTLIIVPVMLLVSRRIILNSKKHFVNQQIAIGQLNGFTEEIISGQKNVQIFNYESKAIAQFNNYNNGLQAKAQKAQFFGGLMMPVMASMNAISFASVTILGSILALTRGLDLGGLAAFLQYSRQFGRPINEVSSKINAFQSALAGAERIFDILDRPIETDLQSTTPIPTLKGDVVFKEVNFAYKPDQPILKSISFTAKAGQKIALVGTTGAGKSTIINLLPRFYDQYSGDILLDGVHLKALSKEALRQQLSIVFQETHLFADTIRENIRYGNLDARDEDVEAAAKVANAYHMIKHLPQGFDTMLEEDGKNLSQGQRQLIAIARAAIKPSQILILDEATSSIDTRTELMIQKGLDNIMASKTSFVIAHRLSTVRDADMILVLEQGRIIEAGSHTTLMAEKGRYYDMHVAQYPHLS